MNKPKSQQPIPENAKKVFEGIIFDVYQWEQEMFDGSKQTFEKVKRIDTAVIIPITEDGKIIVLDQQQPGKGRYLSLPGGMIDKGEEPLEAAKRELLEETGYEAQAIELWHSATPHNKIDWCMYFFIAKGCKKVADQKLDAGEKIHVDLVEVDEFMRMVLSGEIKSSEIVLKLLRDNILAIDQEKSLANIKNILV